MRPVHLVFVHGWGLMPAFWDPLRREMADYPTTTLDLGFFGPPRLAFEPGDAPVVAMGHSLGVLRLLEQSPFPYQALVSLGGFAVYAARPGFEQGIPTATLRAMRRSLTRDPRALLAAFHQACGFAQPPVPPDRQPDVARLAWGLDRLLAADARPRLAGLGVPVLALAARDDAVTPPNMVQASLPGVPIAWLANGGHAFPVNRAETCARILERFLRELP